MSTTCLKINALLSDVKSSGVNKKIELNAFHTNICKNVKKCNIICKKFPACNFLISTFVMSVNKCVILCKTTKVSKAS